MIYRKTWMNGITIEFHIKKVRFEEIRSRFCAFSVMIKKYIYIKINF